MCANENSGKKRDQRGHGLVEARGKPKSLGDLVAT